MTSDSGFLSIFEFNKKEGKVELRIIKNIIIDKTGNRRISLGYKIAVD